MRHLFGRMGKRLVRGLQRRSGRRCQAGGAENLAQALPGTVVRIDCNNDFRTVERGFYPGKQVRVLRNEGDEPNLIVAVGDARYVLDRRIARRIKVSPVQPEGAEIPDRW